jgi:hypothetical protein
MPPTKAVNPTNSGESINCRASQPTQTWYIQKAEFVASVPSSSVRNAGYTRNECETRPASGEGVTVSEERRLTGIRLST